MILWHHFLWKVLWEPCQENTIKFTSLKVVSFLPLSTYPSSMQFFFFKIFIILSEIWVLFYLIWKLPYIFGVIALFRWYDIIIFLQSHPLPLKLIPHISNDPYFPDSDANPSSVHFTGLSPPPAAFLHMISSSLWIISHEEAGPSPKSIPGRRERACMHQETISKVNSLSKGIN